MLDFLIHHIVHMNYFLPVLQNFEKMILNTENLNEVQSSFVGTNCFLKVLKKCAQNIKGMYRHIMQSIMKELKENRQNFTACQFTCDLPR